MGDVPLTDEEIKENRALYNLREYVTQETDRDWDDGFYLDLIEIVLEAYK